MLNVGDRVVGHDVCQLVLGTLTDIDSSFGFSHLIIADNGGNYPSEADLDLAPMPLELQALSDDELEEVFDSLSFEAPVSELAVASLEDMSVGQLEELLQTMMED